MAAHEAADDDGEEEGEGYAEQVAAGRDGADEHHLVHLHGADDELMQRHTQRKARQRPDEGQQVDLAEDVAVDLVVEEAQHLDGGQLLFALAKVHADEVVEHHGGQRSGTDDDQDDHIVQAADEVVEHFGRVLHEGDAADVIAGQQVGAQGVAVVRGGAVGLAVNGVPLRQGAARQRPELRLREVQPGEDVVLGDAGQGQRFAAAVAGLHLKGVAHRKAQALGGLLGQDGTAVVKGDGLVPLPGAEGEICGHLALVFRRHDAYGLLVAAGIVDGHALVVETAPAGHIGAGIQHIAQTVFHGKGSGVAVRDGQVAVVQLGGLAVEHGQDGILDAKADEQQGRAARHAQHGHEEALLIPEQVASRGLLGKAHVLPQRGDVFEEDALAGHRRTGQEQGGGLLAQAGAAGLPGGDADDGRTEQDASHGHAGVELQGEGGQAEHHGLIGLPDDGGEDDEAHRHAQDAAQDAGGQAVEQVLARNGCVGVAQRFQGAHLQAVLVHHAGHGGGGHQCRHQEEEHREDPCDGVHPVGILLKGDEAHGAVPVEDVPLAVLDVRDLLFGIVDLLLAVSEFLFRLGFLRLVFGAGGVQLLFAGIVFGPAVIQPGAGIGELLFGGSKGGIGRGGAGGKPQLALHQFQLHLPQSGFGLGDEFRIGKAGRGEEPLGIHLPLALVQLLLVAVELGVDAVVGGLCLGEGIPQLSVFFVGGFGLVERFLRVVERGLGIGQQRVGHLLQVDQKLDLLELVFKFQDLLLAVQHLVRTALHGVGQGGFLLGQLRFAGGVLRFALLQLRFGGGELGFGLVELLLGLCKLAFGLRFLLVVGLFGIGQFGSGVVDEGFPAGGALCAADGGQSVGDGVHGCLVFIGIIVILVGVFGLDITDGVIIGGQLTVRDVDDGVQNAIAGGGSLLVGGKMQRVLHLPHHGIRGAGETIGAVRQGQRSADGDLFPVAHDMHDAFVGSFGHPAGQQQRAVHILGRVGTGVCRELLDAQDSGLVGAGPAALGVQILHRLDRCDALGRGNGVDVVLGKAEGGEDAQVEYVLLYVIFLPGDPHTGRKAGKARQDHHAQCHDAE